MLAVLTGQDLFDFTVVFPLVSFHSQFLCLTASEGLGTIFEHDQLQEFNDIYTGSATGSEETTDNASRVTSKWRGVFLAQR